MVVDASIALAWCFEDEQTPDVIAILDSLAETGAFAPGLWPLEVLNGLFSAQRRRRLDPARRATLAAFLRALPIRLDGETTEAAWDATSDLADRFGLTVYDAAYLEVAHRRELPLATLDSELRRAAASLGVELLGPDPA